MGSFMVAAQVAVAALWLGATEGCDDVGSTGPCSRAERAVASEVSHPKGLKPQFARDYDGVCLANLQKHEAQSALEHYQRQLPRQGWTSRVREEDVVVFAKDGMTFAVIIETGPEPRFYLTIATDEGP